MSTLVRPSGALDAEVIRHPGAAQISLDDQHPHPTLCKGDSEIGGRCCLAFLRGRGGDDDRPWRPVDVDELKVGAKLTEGLRAGGPGVRVHDQRSLRCLLIEGDGAERSRPRSRCTCSGSLIDVSSVSPKDGTADADYEAEAIPSIRLTFFLGEIGAVGRSARFTRLTFTGELVAPAGVSSSAAKDANCSPTALAIF